VSGPSDIAVLRTIRGSLALPLLRVFISGFASRHDLSVDRLDDIQLAVESLVADEPEDGGDLELEIFADGGRLTLRLDGLLNQCLKAALSATDAFRPRHGCPLDVRMLLDSLVDDYRVVDESAESFAVEMVKRAS